MLLWCFYVLIESSSPTVIVSVTFLLLCFTEESQNVLTVVGVSKWTSVQLALCFTSSSRIQWDWQCLPSLGLATEQKLMSCSALWPVCSFSKKRKTGYVGALPSLSLSLLTLAISLGSNNTLARSQGPQKLTWHTSKSLIPDIHQETTPLHPLHVSPKQTWPCVFVLVSGNRF